MGGIQRSVAFILWLVLIPCQGVEWSSFDNEFSRELRYWYIRSLNKLGIFAFGIPHSAYRRNSWGPLTNHVSKRCDSARFRCSFNDLLSFSLVNLGLVLSQQRRMWNARHFVWGVLFVDWLYLWGIQFGVWLNTVSRNLRSGTKIAAGRYSLEVDRALVITSCAF